LGTGEPVLRISNPHSPTSNTQERCAISIAIGPVVFDARHDRCTLRFLLLTLDIRIRERPAPAAILPALRNSCRLNHPYPFRRRAASFADIPSYSPYREEGCRSRRRRRGRGGRANSHITVYPNWYQLRH